MEQNEKGDLSMEVQWWGVPHYVIRLRQLVSRIVDSSAPLTTPNVLPQQYRVYEASS